MPKQALESLTESMFYVLMAFGTGERCGAEVVAFVEQLTGGALRLGPATLYTILGKFQAEGWLAETGSIGCKRYYTVTAAGRAAYARELARLQRCVADAQRAGQMAFAAAELPVAGGEKGQLEIRN